MKRRASAREDVDLAVCSSPVKGCVLAEALFLLRFLHAAELTLHEPIG